MQLVQAVTPLSYMDAVPSLEQQKSYQVTVPVLMSDASLPALMWLGCDSRQINHHRTAAEQGLTIDEFLLSSSTVVMDLAGVTCETF